MAHREIVSQRKPIEFLAEKGVAGSSFGIDVETDSDCSDGRGGDVSGNVDYILRSCLNQGQLLPFETTGTRLWSIGDP